MELDWSLQVLLPQLASLGAFNINTGTMLFLGLGEGGASDLASQLVGYYVKTITLTAMLAVRGFLTLEFTILKPLLFTSPSVAEPWLIYTDASASACSGAFTSEGLYEDCGIAANESLINVIDDFYRTSLAIGYSLMGIGLTLSAFMFGLSFIGNLRETAKENFKKVLIAGVLAAFSTRIFQAIIEINHLLVHSFYSVSEYNADLFAMWSNLFSANSASDEIAILLGLATAAIAVLALVIELAARYGVMVFIPAIGPIVFLAWAFNFTSGFAKKAFRLFITATVFQFFMVIGIKLMFAVTNSYASNGAGVPAWALLTGVSVLLAYFPKLLSGAGEALDGSKGVGNTVKNLAMAGAAVATGGALAAAGGAANAAKGMKTGLSAGQNGALQQAASQRTMSNQFSARAMSNAGGGPASGSAPSNGAGQGGSQPGNISFGPKGLARGAQNLASTLSDPAKMQNFGERLKREGSHQLTRQAKDAAGFGGMTKFAQDDWQLDRDSKGASRGNFIERTEGGRQELAATANGDQEALTPAERSEQRGAAIGQAVKHQANLRSRNPVTRQKASARQAQELAARPGHLSKGKANMQAGRTSLTNRDLRAQNQDTLRGSTSTADDINGMATQLRGHAKALKQSGGASNKRAAKAMMEQANDMDDMAGGLTAATPEAQFDVDAIRHNNGNMDAARAIHRSAHAENDSADISEKQRSQNAAAIDKAYSMASNEPVLSTTAAAKKIGNSQGYLTSVDPSLTGGQADSDMQEIADQTASEDLAINTRSAYAKSGDGGVDTAKRLQAGIAANEAKQLETAAPLDVLKIQAASKAASQHVERFGNRVQNLENAIQDTNLPDSVKATPISQMTPQQRGEAMSKIRAAWTDPDDLPQLEEMAQTMDMYDDYGTTANDLGGEDLESLGASIGAGAVAAQRQATGTKNSPARKLQQRVEATRIEIASRNDVQAQRVPMRMQAARRGSSDGGSVNLNDKDTSQEFADQDAPTDTRTGAINGQSGGGLGVTTAGDSPASTKEIGEDSEVTTSTVEVQEIPDLPSQAPAGDTAVKGQSVNEEHARAEAKRLATQALQRKGTPKLVPHARGKDLMDRSQGEQDFDERVRILQNEIIQEHLDEMKKGKKS